MFKKGDKITKNDGERVMKCEYCGYAIVRPRFNQRFCSDSHRVIKWRKINGKKPESNKKEEKKMSD